MADTETRMNPILQAVDLFRSFPTADGTLTVLKGISLSLHEGEMAAVTGASGVGKSTLLHILGGLDLPTKGEVRIQGELLTDKNENQLAEFRAKRVGFVFQHHYLLDDFTALENVMIPQLVVGESRTQAEKRAEDLLSQIGLTQRAGHRPAQLSGGEQQRVAVARALANQPAMVIADEPSGNLDTQTGEHLHDLLASLSREQNVTMVLATHNKDLANRCSVRCRMFDGRLEREA